MCRNGENKAKIKVLVNISKTHDEVVLAGVGTIFAGAARRAGPDSMLILCVCVHLR